jgi:hypothetical protein
LVGRTCLPLPMTDREEDVKIAVSPY